MSTVESQRRSEPPRLFVVMGVAGCGKSTIGEAVARKMEAVFLDGDAYHPAANIEKMSNGVPLTDSDRWPWLKHFAGVMRGKSGTVFGGCSALKRSYRDYITQCAGEPVTFIYLDGSRELIEHRMTARSGHFMPTSLLDSQFATLEVPAPDENAVAIDITPTTDVIASNIQQWIQRTRR